ERNEPARLIEMRRQREVHRARDIAPGTTESRGAYAEVIAARRHIRIERFPARTGVDPIFVETLQLVSKRGAHRDDKTERRVTEVQVRPSRRQRRDVLGVYILAVHPGLFDDDVLRGPPAARAPP